MSGQFQGPTLVIVAHGAQTLFDIEAIGKQDPYLQVSTDLGNPKSFQKTFVHKDAGKTPTWNQTFTVPLAGEPELFVEIMDEETTADAVIAFAAIPINQIVHAPGANFNGVFDVYTPAGKPAGVLNLTLTAHNVPGQNTAFVQGSPAPVKGTSHISEQHQKRVTSIKHKEQAADAGTAAVTGLLAVGAGLLVNKFMNDNKKEEAAKKEAERQRLDEQSKFDAERRKLEADRAAFAAQQQQHQQQQQQFQQQQQYQQQGGFPTQAAGAVAGAVAGAGVMHGVNSSYHESSSSSHYEKKHDKHDKYDKHDKSYKKDKKDKKKYDGHGGSSSDSDSGSDNEYKKNKKDKKHWNPTGHYSAGDKVKFQGRKFICLQSHDSNPSWEPTAAHSLWRSD
ncbi:hypothetical protein BG004_002588 [Podila humilis]|nr:hypothetical protein BG004_002588 [Podila humilis]